MKHRVSELEGALLDAAVAKAEGRMHKLGADGTCWIKTGRSNDWSKWDDQFQPSTDWRWGGPIIERERIVVFPSSARSDAWAAFRFHGYSISGGEQRRDDALPGDVVVVFDGTHDRAHGPTPLIAAMRAYVASKFGEEVELP